MKKYVLATILWLSCFAIKAQDYNTIKNMVALQNFSSAKEKLDAAFTTSGFTTHPEAYILKATVYAGLATTTVDKGIATDALLTDADAAFRKFRTMDAGMSLLSDQLYQTAPINIYSGLYTSGYADYQNKNWTTAAGKFKKVMEYSDLLIQKKLITATLDTNALVLAGVVNENAGNKEDAAKYYSRLADAAIAGSGFESVYRYLVNYYFIKKNIAAFEKYKAAGKAQYPQSEYFTFDRVDFAVGLETDFNKKIQALDELLATEPNNQKGQEVLGELIYDTLNAATVNLPVAVAAQLEQKMITAFHKSAALKPGYENPFIYIGDHFINKSAAIKEAETKNGTTAAQEQQYLASLDIAREHYEKAATIFAAKTSLADKDKVQYRKVTSYLTDIYKIKKSAAKGNAADAAAFETASKIWDAVNASIH